MTTTTTTTVSTTLPPVQVVNPSDLIQQCEQPLIIGTMASSVVMGVASNVIFGVVFSKMAASTFK